jgi:hypothetical protein
VAVLVVSRRDRRGVWKFNRVLLLSREISRIALGMAAGVMIGTQSSSLSIRQNLVAARLPIAPLTSLLAGLGCQALIIGLSIVASWISILRDKSGSRISSYDLDLAQALLSKPLAIVHEEYGARPAALKGKDMFNDETDGILRVTRRVNGTSENLRVHECEFKCR